MCIFTKKYLNSTIRESDDMQNVKDRNNQVK